MSSTTETAAQFIRDHFACEGWEVSHVDTTDRKVYIAVPQTVTALTDALAEILDETGSIADLDLTSEGATITLWVPAIHERANDSEAPATTKWWHGLAVALAAVVAASSVMIYPTVMLGNVTNNSSEEPSGESSNAWGGIW